ncbi:nucleotidyltransferase family protein [Paraclostridium bifermentans]|uniref:nucleotidyltransferase family protein n=1 Tax=Paraclostridium bifermentans TaxID=1490 RepID=UPI0022E0568D|nr:nucleotidyltransferase family protein [Paraclostridium bifermentans]
MDINQICINDNLSIRQAIEILDNTAKKILLVVNENKLQAVITDGDIRRWILKNGDLSKSVKNIMNKNPKYITIKNKSDAKNIMKENRIEAIPVVDDYMNIIDIVFWNETFDNNLNYVDSMDIPIVIMAGGKGTRLYPYTKILPKPLIPIGDTPIIERIMDRFSVYGSNKFYLTVNYKKDMIKAYFNDSDKKYNVSYIEEEKPLGTGGSLHLLKDELRETFFVSNCDILIDANYSDVLKYHRENKNKITVVTSLKHYKIPYGVVELNEESSICSTVEKPEYSFLVNTGMYLLEPETLQDIPEDEFYHITDLIESYLNKGIKVGTYPVTDQCWLDMGEFKEMERMIERLGV